MKMILRLFMLICALVVSGYSPASAEPWDQDSARMKGEVSRMEEEMAFLRSAVTRTTSLDSMAARSTMTLNVEGENTVTINTDLKFRNRNSGDLIYQVELNKVKAGVPAEQRLFYTGGYYCMDAAGQKLKAAMDLDEARQDLNYDPNSIGLAGLDSIQSLQITDDGNGNKLCTFTCDADMMEMSDYIYYIYQQMDLIWADIEIKEMKGSFLVNQKGYCVAQTMYLALDVSVDQKTAADDIKIDIEYVNPGGPVEFVLPSTEEYTEV